MTDIIPVDAEFQQLPQTIQAWKLAHPGVVGEAAMKAASIEWKAKKAGAPLSSVSEEDNLGLI